MKIKTSEKKQLKRKLCSFLHFFSFISIHLFLAHVLYTTHTHTYTESDGKETGTLYSDKLHAEFHRIASIHRDGERNENHGVNTEQTVNYSSVRIYLKLNRTSHSHSLQYKSLEMKSATLSFTLLCWFKHAHSQKFDEKTTLSSSVFVSCVLSWCYQLKLASKHTACVCVCVYWVFELCAHL